MEASNIRCDWVEVRTNVRKYGDDRKGRKRRIGSPRLPIRNRSLSLHEEKLKRKNGRKKNGNSFKDPPIPRNSPAKPDFLLRTKNIELKRKNVGTTSNCPIIKVTYKLTGLSIQSFHARSLSLCWVNREISNSPSIRSKKRNGSFIKKDNEKCRVLQALLHVR